MSASIDFSEIREMTIAFSGLSHMDNEYTFFYDETNNSRLFRITETDFNASKDEDFVLGGLVYEEKHKAFDMEKLLQSLRLQPTMKEVKRKHIAPGNSFLECINSRKLQTLLEWIIENKIYIHFMAMNNLYYGVVDIVDSLIADTELSGLPWEYITHMKNALYKYINADIAYIHEVFLHYGYPNIADESVREFCEVLIGWYFFLIVRLKKLSKSMAAQGCAIKPIKERFSNHKLVGSLLTVLAVVIACGFLFFGSYRMDWTPKEASTNAQVIEAHERLLALGYPESELNDLSDEDLLTCLRAERVVIKECTGSAYINYSNKPQTNDAFHLTIVAVQRPFDRLFVACHFRWDDGVRFYGTESLAFEPNHDSNSWFAKEFSGRVLYDGPDGTAYTAPYIDPGTDQVNLGSW